MPGEISAAFLSKLEQRREQAISLAEAWLRGIPEGRLSPAQELEYRSHVDAIKAISDRVTETRAEVARCGSYPLGAQSRMFNTAGRLAPLSFAEPEVRRLREAALRGESCRLESRLSFNSVDNLLPAELFGTPIAHIHDNRVLDKLPGYQMETASIEFIRHTSTTGAAGAVAEGATKPEVVFVTDQITLRAVKLAAHNALSYEIISDWPAFQSYCGTELGGQVVDVENNQLLNGDGLTGNMTGFYLTSGILTHDCATDAGTNETHLDSIEKAITALRVGPALATPDLLVLNPADWSKLRRTKDLQARYLTQADPTVGEANSLWGIPVVVTTQNPVGKGLLIDTTKFGYVGIREAMSMRVGYANDDLVKNLLRTVAEERLVLCVTRPSAVLSISNI